LFDVLGVVKNFGAIHRIHRRNTLGVLRIVEGRLERRDEQVFSSGGRFEAANDPPPLARVFEICRRHRVVARRVKAVFHEAIERARIFQRGRVAR
jgi:hypothetical protein